MIATSSYANKSKTFWETLPYVLPCKFCRASLTDYYELLPIPDKQEEFPEWLYKIHNLVNQKLRDQGQNLPPDPPFAAVKERYDQLLDQGCSRTEFPGWNFLFSIADNHPSLSPSAPMPDSPAIKPKSIKERNHYNLLTPQERKKMIALFWKSIPAILPFPEWQKSWNSHAKSIQKAIKHRKSALSWLWTIRCGMESDLELIGKTSFYGLCKQVANHRSGCGKSTRAKTCRKISTAHKGGRRKTRTRKQR